MASYVELYKSVRALRTSIKKSESLVVEILVHPDATADSIRQMREMLMKNRAMYQEVYESLLKLGERGAGVYDPKRLKF